MMTLSRNEKVDAMLLNDWVVDSVYDSIVQQHSIYLFNVGRCSAPSPPLYTFRPTSWHGFEDNRQRF